MELMDEWESNTNRRICWGSVGRYWVASELQVEEVLLVVVFWQRGEADEWGAFEKGRKRYFGGGGGDLQRRGSGKGKKGGSFQLKRVAGCLA